MNTSSTIERPNPVLPTEKDTELAAAASRTLARTTNKELRVRLNDVELELPKAVSTLIYHILTEMGKGNAITVIPIHAELTTQEAADLLNISRPHLIRLLEDKKIPFHKVGTHRRIKFTDLQNYRSNFNSAREDAMQELAEQAQELGMGY